MKTANPTCPILTLRVIDLAPLRSRYKMLCASIIMLIEAGQIGRMLRLSHKAERLVKAYTRLDTHNRHLALKLEMLINTSWRERVLKELGGLRKLKLWEAARARIAARAAAPSRPVLPLEPNWLFTPARMAESERLKARKREVFRAGHNSLIVRNRCKVDFEGEFRLAPLPRGECAARRMKVYTAKTIIDYDWNPMPIAKEKGFGPACVWPVEFYAAMAIEAQSDRNRGNSNHLSDTITTERRSRKTSDVKTQRPSSSSFRVPLRGPGMTDKKNRKSAVLTTPLHQALSPKEYRYFFGSSLS